jgi:hypothetical protein
VAREIRSHHEAEAAMFGKSPLGGV